MTVRNLDKLLNPRSVAVVGASPRPGSLGAIAWRNLRGAGFAGPLFAVNPHHETLDGVPVHARLRELPQPPDLALLCTPPPTIAGLVAELGPLAERKEVREADAARACPVEHGAQQRARLRHEGQLARQGVGAR